MPKSNRSKLIHELLKGCDQEFSDEELMHLLTEQKITANTNHAPLTFGQKAADAVARFAGSWAFIVSFLAVMALWMALNIGLAAHAFDPYPFILLNLVLSCIAAVQAPLIMMSQNRQEEKDRERAESDYKVNLKTELIIDDLYTKMDRILENQRQILKALKKAEEETTPQK